MLMTKEKTIFKKGKGYTVRDVVVEYWGSDAFRKLGAASQKDYYDCLMVINDDIRTGYHTSWDHAYESYWISLDEEYNYSYELKNDS